MFGVIVVSSSQWAIWPIVVAMMSTGRSVHDRGFSNVSLGANYLMLCRLVRLRPVAVMMTENT